MSITLLKMSFSFQMKIIIAIVIINIYFLYIYLLFYDCLVSLIVILQLSIHDYKIANYFNKTVENTVHT